MRHAVILACVLVAQALPAAAQSPAPPPGGFQLPVRCAAQDGCRIQHYVDQDPSKGVRDYTCGHLSYDGHNGVDFAVANLAAMQRGVDVVAAADGTVYRIHDGVADVSMDETGPGDSIDAINGNSVTLEHPGGWRSLYAHLQRGSLRVRQGQEVKAGTVLGQIGLSGNSNFPHLHFTLSHDGWIIDPFLGTPQNSGCESDGAEPARRSLWAADTSGLLAYRPGGLIDSGFTVEAAPSEAQLQGFEQVTLLPAESPRVTFWIMAWGLRRGDRETLRLYGPDGDLLGETRAALDEAGAVWIRQASLQGQSAWPSGRYRATYRVERGDGDAATVVIDIARSIEVR